MGCPNARQSGRNTSNLLQWLGVVGGCWRSAGHSQHAALPGDVRVWCVRNVPVQERKTLAVGDVLQCS